MMDSVRNIPYGFSTDYEIVTKIIGSKYIRCLVGKNEGTKQSVKAETKSMLSTLLPSNARQKHGNLPSQNKPPFQQACSGLSDEQQNKGGKEEHKSKQAEETESRFVSNPDTMQESTERYQENNSLLAVLRKELEVTPLSVITLDNLQEECKVLDPKASGSLSHAQLSHLLLKHEIPLQLPTVKQLFKKYSQASHQELVNYEKLIQFLKLVPGCKIQQRLDHAQKSNEKNQSKSFWTPEDAFHALKQILKQCKGELDLEKLRLSFLQQDNTCSGLLSVSETEMICQKHGLPLHPGMIEVLVNTNNLSRRGKIIWKQFVEFLKKAQTGIDPASFTCGKRNKEKGEDNSQKDKEEQKYLAFKTCKQINQDASGKSEEQDAWIDRFRKLERALHLSDVKNTGKLEKEKAKRLIHNYNQIYDLCLSPLKIDKAFRPFYSGQEMPLEPLLDYLKEL